MKTGDNLRINGDRLWNSINEMAKIGPGIAGGNNRQTVTDEDGEGRHLFRQWCEEAGMTMGVDQMGNMFMYRAGEDKDALPVYVGSHLDTQPTGGRYDGILGVLSGLELVRTLNDLNIKTRHPIVVTNWTNEEGTRFAPALLASSVFTGVHSQDWAYNQTDEEGKTFGEELQRIGWKGDEETGNRRMRAFFELHIEQGPILEAEGKDIGIVTHGQGLIWIKVTISGQDAHAGSTPMNMRKDAGRGMARVVELVNEIAMSHQPLAVGTVGKLNLHPASPNVIPGKAECTIDFRSPKMEILKDMENRLYEGTKEICSELGLEAEFEIIGGYDPVQFDETCVSAVRNSAEKLGYSHRDIVSGAGHDACAISKVAPTAMVFCPCVDGLSHNEAEEITKEWATAGAEVLMHAVLEKAEVVGGKPPQTFLRISILIFKWGNGWGKL
ncbi:MAG: Zn-dependent hydrolase [Pseudomonadota bacterium]